jgi:hypothetical protein
MIFQEQYITTCQYISSHASGFTKVAEDPAVDFLVITLLMGGSFPWPVSERLP